jgi:hypothetical protein
LVYNGYWYKQRVSETLQGLEKAQVLLLHCCLHLL